MRATPDQVIITRGSHQAVDLIARLLLRPGDTVWFEDPQLGERGRYDRASVFAILDLGFVAHVAFIDDGRPVVIPWLTAGVPWTEARASLR